MTTFRKPLRGVVNTLPLDRGSPKPLHRQIYDEFRERILGGDLGPGNVVPSTRQLASDLHISRLPVLEAYSQLLAEGYFETRIGSGTYVSRSLQRAPATNLSQNPSGSPRSRRVSTRAMRLPPYERPFWADNLGPFQVGQPELHDFPAGIWSRLVGRYARSIHVKNLQYSGPFGMSELRNAIAT